MPMTKSERAALGGRARAAKLTAAQLAEIGHRGARGRVATLSPETRQATLENHVQQLIFRASELSADQWSRLLTSRTRSDNEGAHNSP